MRGGASRLNRPRRYLPFGSSGNVQSIGALGSSGVTPTPPVLPPTPIEPTFGSGPQPRSHRPPWGIVSEGGWRRPDETPEVEPTFDADALRDARRGVLDVTRAAASMVGAGTVQEVLRATGDLVRPEAQVTGLAHVENEDEWLQLL